jgi:fructose-1-phosphate kinase PfkB-like protein
MGGSLPAGVPLEFFAEYISRAHAHSLPVIFDSSGAALAAGIKGRPDLIKPNQSELADLLGTLPGSREEVLAAATNLQQLYGCDVIVTLGEEGAITVFDNGSYFVQPLSIPILSSAGAGDGVLAGMALAYHKKESCKYGLQHGFALAGAVLKTLATADFLVEDYRELLPQIRISPIE